MLHIKLISIAFLCLFMIAGNAYSEELTVEQRVMTKEMYSLVLTRGIVQHIVKRCSEFKVNESAMAKVRAHIFQKAKPQFPSKEAFLIASGSDKKAELAEDIRRFFYERGLKWDDSREDYCELGSALFELKSHITFALTQFE